MKLKQLANVLGLSPTTVSRALNGYPEVNEATRERVLAAAKQYNYQPNARALQLATGKAKAIGHVIPIAARHEMVNPVFADFIAGQLPAASSTLSLAPPQAANPLTPALTEALAQAGFALAAYTITGAWKMRFVRRSGNVLSAAKLTASFAICRGP